MGTNFYTTKGKHIGKCAAAGLYCWDCHETLCKEGESGIHTGKSHWFDACPSCGKKYEPQPLEKQEERIGITMVSSFSWAIWPHHLKRLRCVISEYGDKYTLCQFLDDVIDNCPVQFLDSIGQDFS